MNTKAHLHPQPIEIRNAKWLLLWLAIVASLILSQALGLAQEEPDRSGKMRVVCFGDSITKRGYPELLGEALKVETINAGVAGHSSSAGLKRMQKDVLDQKPVIVVIFFGTNDLRADEPRVYVPVEKYGANLERMVGECHKAGAKVVICTLPPIDEKAFFQRHETKEYDKLGGLSELLENYRKKAITIAESRELPVVDLNKKLREQPEWLSKDGVHPTPKGNRIIARLIGAAVAPLIEK